MTLGERGAVVYHEGRFSRRRPSPCPAGAATRRARATPSTWDSSTAPAGRRPSRRASRSARRRRPQVPRAGRARRAPSARELENFLTGEGRDFLKPDTDQSSATLGLNGEQTRCRNHTFAHSHSPAGVRARPAGAAGRGGRPSIPRREARARGGARRRLRAARLEARRRGGRADRRPRQRRACPTRFCVSSRTCPSSGPTAYTTRYRALVVLLARAGGGFKRAAVATRLLGCTLCAGALGDPEGINVQIDIKNGVLNVHQLSGSREATDLTQRFRYDAASGRFALIGQDSETYDRIGGDSEWSAPTTSPASKSRRGRR